MSSRVLRPGDPGTVEPIAWRQVGGLGERRESTGAEPVGPPPAKTVPVGELRCTSTDAWPGAFQEIVTTLVPAGSGFGLAVRVGCASTGTATASAKRNTQLVIFFT